MRGFGDVSRWSSKLIIRFDYGLTIPWVQRSEEGLTAVAGYNALILRADVPTFGENLSTLARFSVGEGERKSFILTAYPSHAARAGADQFVVLARGDGKLLAQVGCPLHVPGGMARRGCAFSPDAKALNFRTHRRHCRRTTTSLPEKLGGVRNWDYRICWLRDATFTLYSLMQAGYTEEAAAWSHWLLRAIAGDPAQLQIMYGASGERRLTEVELTHLAGYENSSPVRIGNAASEQFQLDVYGEVMDAMHLAREMKIDCDPAYWHLQRHLIDSSKPIGRCPMRASGNPRAAPVTSPIPR